MRENFRYACPMVSFVIDGKLHQNHTCHFRHAGLNDGTPLRASIFGREHIQNVDISVSRRSLRELVHRIRSQREPVEKLLERGWNGQNAT